MEAKQIIVLSLAWILPFVAVAQKLPDKLLKEALFGRFGQEEVTDLVQHNTMIAAVGSSTSSKNGGRDVYLIMMDEALNMKYERYIGRDGDDAANAIVVTANGYYAVAGYSTKPNKFSPASKKYYGKKDAWLLLLDEKGQTVKEFILGTTQDDELTNVFSLSNGDLLLVGNSGDQAWIIRLNIFGEVVWEHKLNYYALKTHTNRALLTDDQQLILTGNVKDNDIQQMWMAAFDLAGKTLWQKTMPASKATNGLGIRQLPNKQIGLVGYVYDKSQRENGFFCLIDTSGEQAHYLMLGGRENDRLFDLAALNEEDVILLGKSKSYSRGSRRDKIWTVKLDKSYAPVDEAFYGTKAMDVGTALLMTNQGSLLLGGFSSQQLLKARQAMIAQLTEKRSIPKIKEPLNWKLLGLPVGQSTSEVGTRTFIPIELSNPNDKTSFNLRAVFKPLDGAPPIKSVVLEPIFGGSKKVILLPIKLDEELLMGVYSYQIELFEGTYSRSTPLGYELKVGPVSAPDLRLLVEDLPNTIQTGRRYAFKIAIKNQGTIKAEQVKLTINGDNMASQAFQINAGDLEPGAERQYIFPYLLSNTISTDSIQLKLRVADVSLNYTNAVEISLPVEQTQELLAQIDTIRDHQKEQLTAIWLFPNPDLYDQQEIVWHNEELIIQVKVLSKKGVGKQHFCLEINGEACDQGAKMDEVSMKGSEYSRTYFQKVKLNEGITYLKATIKNDYGQVQTKQLKVVYSPRKPNLHLISIGVPAVDLKYTGKDARDFTRAIQGNGKIVNRAFGNIFIDTLTHAVATTKTEILKTLKRLQYRYEDRQIGSNDLILIFISSHGLSTSGGKFRIAASDYDGPFVNETSLDFQEEIINYLKPINCQKLFFIDACHSGSGYADLEVSGERITEMVYDNRDINLLVSCQADEYSYEDENWENGAFTEALITALNNYQIDDKAVEALDVVGLFEAIQDVVPSLVRNKRPKTKTNQNPILILTDKHERIILFQKEAKY
ncbi:MAG: caspase family protein [Bacteroidota bacterium]